MAGRAKLRSSLRRWHVWLGWVVGVPMLFWTLSGVVMVIRPIEEVRGTALLRDPPPMALASQPPAPAIAGISLKKLALEQRAAGPRWVLSLADGNSRLADPGTGALLPPLGSADAVREVMSRYRGTARIVSVSRTTADHPPLDLRKPIATWAVAMSDGTHFYVDAGSGEVVARRTRFWRLYDWMWGLHIMDLQGREDTHNKWLVGFAILALLTTLLALALLPLSAQRKRSRLTGTATHTAD
jgi:uncharacterized iron-regulated membrane protein